MYKTSKKNSKKIILSIAVTVAMVFSMTACGGGSEEVAPANENWVLTGYYAEDTINAKAIDKKAAVSVWDKASGEFVEAENTEDVILGNYTKLTDEDKDGKADLIEVVNFEDGPEYWDADMAWLDGVATEETNPDQAIDDKTGRAMYDVEYRIPMGERQLANWGITDWSGTTDWAVYEDSPYWQNTEYDFYNLTSSDTLTMLTGYKTSLQETGATCVMNSALSTLEWYGQRADMNAKDLASLRSAERDTTGGSSLDELQTVYDKLGELGITGKWKTEGYNDDPELIYDPAWVIGHLEKGHPIVVIWNSYGPHGQVIIGYDDMGTIDTNDDVLIMMDPYDTTDHNPDGYIIQSYERLIYGTLTWDEDTTATKYMAVWPADGWDYTAVKGEGMPADTSNTGNVADIEGNWETNVMTEDSSFAEINGMKIPYDTTADDLKAYYEKYAEDVAEYFGTGLSGAAGVERTGDVAASPYYELDDFYGTEDAVRAAVGSDTLQIIDNFATTQQSTEFSCGVTSAYMAIYNYGLMPEKDGKLLESDASLAAIRQIDEETGLGEPGGTYITGIDEIFAYMSETYDQKWVTFDDLDLVYNEDWEWNSLGSKWLEGDLMPYLIENNVPILIGWDEWGGHWQVVIGYDGMGTEATQDDVLILADPYDTTDHNQNGYVIESFERLVYGWNAAFEWWNDEETGEEDDGYYAMYIAIPDTDEYAEVIAELQAEPATE